MYLRYLFPVGRALLLATHWLLSGEASVACGISGGSKTFQGEQGPWMPSNPGEVRHISSGFTEEEGARRDWCAV